MRRFVLLLIVFSTCGVPEGLCAPDEPSGSPPGSAWSRRDTSVLVGGLLGAATLSLFDEKIHAEADEHRHSDLSRVSDGFDLLGNPVVTLGIGGAIYGTGMLRQDAELAQTGRLAVQAVLVAEAATLALKAGFGRERPNDDEDAWSFRPFGLEEDHNAFPSAHTSGAFALAAVLARRSDRPHAPYLYYGLASLVALSRVYDEEHWASDVAVGALIGELSARLVVRASGDEDGWLIGAQPAPGGALLAVSCTW